MPECSLEASRSDCSTSESQPVCVAWDDLGLTDCGVSSKEPGEGGRGKNMMEMVQRDGLLEYQGGHSLSYSSLSEGGGFCCSQGPKE